MNKKRERIFKRLWSHYIVLSHFCLVFCTVYLSCVCVLCLRAANILSLISRWPEIFPLFLVARFITLTLSPLPFFSLSFLLSFPSFPSIRGFAKYTFQKSVALWLCCVLWRCCCFVYFLFFYFFVFSSFFSSLYIYVFLSSGF